MYILNSYIKRRLYIYIIHTFILDYTYFYTRYMHTEFLYKEEIIYIYSTYFYTRLYILYSVSEYWMIPMIMIISVSLFWTSISCWFSFQYCGLLRTSIHYSIFPITPTPNLLTLLSSSHSLNPNPNFLFSC